MNFKKVVFLIHIIYQSLQVFCQSISDYEFTTKLIRENRIQSALHFLKIPNDLSHDTLYYLRGLSYYYLKKPDSTVLWLKKINTSNLLRKSDILLSLSLSYLNKNDEAIIQPHDVTNIPDNENYFIISNILNAGNFLILKNYSKYDSTINQISNRNFKYNSILNNLNALKNQQIKFKKKSPLLSATLSTFVPGLGKLYVGRKGEAMSMFIANAIFAGFTFESYYRTKKITSPPTIIFGTLFSFFYTGNIIGSFHAAKRHNISKQKQIKNEILANMHTAASYIID